LSLIFRFGSQPQDCGCQDLCKFRRTHYGLVKNACSQCSKSRTDTDKVKCLLLFQLARCTNRACCQSHPVEMFIKTTMPRDKSNQNSELFFRLMRYLVVYNFGCLIQSLECLQLLSAIQCVECA
jgi:hypothetical protein